MSKGSPRTNINFAQGSARQYCRSVRNEMSLKSRQAPHTTKVTMGWYSQRKVSAIAIRAASMVHSLYNDNIVSEPSSVKLIP